MRIVARMDELFSIDAQARVDHLDHAARQELHLDRARPLLDLLKQQIEAARVDALPSSALGKAARYTLALWRKLTLLYHPPSLCVASVCCLLHHTHAQHEDAMGRNRGSECVPFGR